MAREELLRFVESAKERGLGDETIAGMLKASGWAENDAYGALRDYYQRSAGLEIPSRKGIAEGARDAFVYLLSFGTLGTWTVAAGALLFGVIEHLFPDKVLSPGYASPHASAQSLASVLVAFPVYLLVSRAAVRDARENPEKSDSPIRRWLTWLALLVAAGVVIGDLITFLAYLLRGEITIRFVLKVVTVLILAGGVFWYYVTSMWKATNHKVFAAAASGVVLASIVAGFAMMGSPGRQRSVEADRRRIEQLNEIAAELRVRGAPLPDTLAGLRSPSTDPVTGQPYHYRRFGDTKYEICAVFAMPSGKDASRLPGTFGPHRAGRDCFAVDITAGAGKW